MADDLNWQLVARATGSSWDEIEGHVGQSSQAALDAGYEPDEISQYLGYKPPQPMRDLAEGSWGNALQADPDLVAAMALSSQAPDLTANPGWRGDYANAIEQGHATGPQDFGDEYAAAAYNAMMRHVGSLDPEQAKELQNDFAAQADAMRGRLPHPRDFTDAALGLGADDAAAARTNLVNHWRDTGQDPAAAAMQARKDDELRRKLSQPAAPEPGFFDKLGASVRDIIGGATQFVSHLLPDGFTDAVNTANDKLSDLGLPLAKVGPDGIDGLERARLKLLRDQGYDGWVRTGGQIAAALPLFTTLGLEGLGGAIAAGATGGALFSAFTPSEAKDYWADKAKEIAEGGAAGAALGVGGHYLFNAIGNVISKMTPEAANALREAVPDLLNPKVDVVSPGSEQPITRAPLATASVEPAKMIEVTPEIVASAKATAGEMPAAGAGARKLVQGGAQAPVGEATGTVASERMIEVTPAVVAEAEGALGKELKIDPGATPAEKMARIAQLHTDNITQTSIPSERPNFFQELYQRSVDVGHLDADPKVAELAKSWDGSRAVRELFSNMVSKAVRGVLDDNTGAVPLPQFRTPAQAAARLTATDARNDARNRIIGSLGQMNQAVYQNRELAMPLMRALVPHLDEWEGELAKGPAGLPRDTVVGKFLSYVEGRSNGVAIDPNNPLAPYADVWREVNQGIDQRLRQQAVDGVIHYDGYIQDYAAHMYKDPAAATDAFGVGTGRFGSRGNLMERQGPPTILDAVEKGLQLKYTDPHQLLMADMEAKLKFSYAADMIDQAHTDGYLRWTLSKMPGDVQLGTGFGRKLFTDANGNPQEINLFGHPQFVQQVKDLLSPGYYGRPSASPILNGLLYMKNSMTALKLALPLFHATVASMATMAGRVGQGIEEGFRGQFADAFKSIMGSAVAPYTDARLGRRMLQQYAAGANDPVLEALVNQNLGIGKGQPLYERFGGTVQSAWQSLLAGRSVREYMADAQNGTLPLGTLPRELRKDLSAIAGDAQTEMPAFRAVMAVPRLAAFGIKEGQRAISTIAGPLFDEAIPMMKLGGAGRRLQSWLTANPNATPEAVAKYARQVTQDVDNRLGELNFDNVFWPKAVKQTMQMAMISPGWVYGTYRGLASALGVDLERRAFQFNPVATSSLIGTLAVFGMGNAVMTALHTGEMPKSFQDLMMYRTGQKIKFGLGAGVNDERGMIPSELKEYFDIGKIFASSLQTPGKAPGAAADYALGKLAPVWQGLRMAMTGQDGLGHNINEMPGGWARFAAETFRPIFMSAEEGAKKGSGFSAAERIAGFREAPKWAEAWTANQNWMAKNEDRIRKQEIARARGEVAAMQDVPWWGQNLPQPQGRGRAPGAAQRAEQQFEINGQMPTNPRMIRYLNTIRDYNRERTTDPLYDPDRERMMGNTLRDRLNRARRAGPLDPMRGY